MGSKGNAPAEVKGAKPEGFYTFYTTGDTISEGKITFKWIKKLGYLRKQAKIYSLEEYLLGPIHVKFFKPRRF